MNGTQLTNQQQADRPRTIRLRTAVMACFICVLINTLLLGASLGAVYLLGRQGGADRVAESRQTVVQEGEAIADVAQQVGPSVVSILTQRASTSSLFGAQSGTAAGTGVIIDKSGLVLTNKHVIPEGTNSVEVMMSDGTRYSDVTLIGRDPLNDLAILRINDARDLQPARLADSDEARVGQKVIAIGNALGQFRNTVTAGIISGIGRPVQAGDGSGQVREQLTDLLQTDAAINSGNSGGPLLNFNGEVIGINTAVAADAQNIGFAIPINEAKGIINSVLSTGKLSRPYIGVRYVSLTPALARQLNLSVNQGAYISTDPGAVVAGSPAERAGLQAGDVITKVGDTQLGEQRSLTGAIGRHKAGDTITLTIVRDGKEQQVAVVLGEAPSN